MKAFFTTALLFFCSIAHAQVAIIQDKDGYTNVRKAPNGQAKVIHKIYENEVFWYQDDSNDTSDWVTVYIPKEDFSIACLPHELITGFIHQSRLKPLGTLTPE